MDIDKLLREMARVRLARPPDPADDLEGAIAQGEERIVAFCEQGRFKQSLEVANEMATLVRLELNEDEPLFSSSLNSLAALLVKRAEQCQSMGNYKAAEQMCQQALEIRRRVLGEDHPDYAACLSSLGHLYDEMGLYKEAEPLVRQALEIRRRALGEDHPDYAVCLNNLACLYCSMENYSAAEPLLRQALEIRRRVLGDEHSDYAQSLNNLAVLYGLMGNYSAAEPLHRQALEIQRYVLGENNPAQVSILNSLGLLYEAMGNYEAAEHLLRQARDTCRRVLGENHAEYANSLDNLAAVYRSREKSGAARPLLRQTREIRRRLLGEDHPVYAQSLNSLARLDAATDNPQAALRLMLRAARIQDRLIGQIFAMGSESQRSAYLAARREEQDILLSLVWEYLTHSPDAVRSAFDRLLCRKAIGTEALATQRDAALAGKYPELQPKFRALTALRMQIARKTLDGPGPDGADAHQRLLAGWQAEQEALEASLVRQVPEMNLEQKLRAADRQSVALALPRNAALVEFVRFDVFAFKAVHARGERQWQPARYLAFVLPAGEPDRVQLIDLGEAASIDRLIADFRASITGEIESRAGRDLGQAPREQATQAESAGQALRAVVFDRLRPALGGRKRLLLAPDGDQTRLPFEVLPISPGRCLLDDYRISYLSTGRDVLRFGATSSSQPSAPLVVGAPDFDLCLARPAAAPARSKLAFWARWFRRARPAPVPASPSASAAVPGRRSRDMDRGHFHFGPLPATRTEAERVAELLHVRPCLGEAVLDGPLKSSCRSPRIVHIATHGFFLADRESDPNRQGRDLGLPPGTFAEQDRLSGPLPENPLLRSGLALAGANTWLRDGPLPEEAEDGLLTAEDVSGLDLLDTQLAVLSACETGLGEVRTGEGVFGLRRAFVLAGVKALVMSLWKVPDEQTCELMTDFYRRVLAGQGVADALRDAQLALRATHPDPFYWGAFICQGDPGPLAGLSQSPA